jgi:ribonuclease HI
MPTRTSSGTIVMHIDGGSRGNPGLAAFAVVVDDAGGARLDAFAKVLGQTTNNVAEYEGLLAALSYAIDHHHPRVKVVSDSELLVRQMQGRYKVKSADLKPLFQQAQEMARKLEAFSIEHVRRELNRDADRLVNEALDAAEAGNAAPPTRVSSAPRLKTTARYHGGVLKLSRPLPLADDEEVDVVVHRKI